MTRLVLYVAHPLGAPDRAGLEANLHRAMRWLSWLRCSFPETTFVAPWIASVVAGADDSSEAEREAGLVDDCAVVERLDGLVLCGGRISSGMARERKVARRCWDLTDLDAEPMKARPVARWTLWAAPLEVAAPAAGVPQEPGNRRNDAPASSSAPDLESPKPCARRLPGGWCYRTDPHAESECQGAPVRELASADYGPGRVGRG